MSTQPMDGRLARRLEAMRRAQELALALFEEKGFDAVTVEEVARAANVGPASLYRNFGTKEGLVLWDEYDPMLFESVARHLETQPPFLAVRDGVIEAIAEVYQSDRKRVLRRANLIATTPALVAATRNNLHALREGLAKVLGARVRSGLERELLAGVFASMLEVSVEQWRREKARRPLAAIVREAFRVTAKLAS